MPASVGAQQATKVGRARIHPSVTVKGCFDDNVYLNSDNEKSDFINTIYPRIQLDLPFGAGNRHSTQIIYSAEIKTFSDYTDENSVNQDAGLDFHLNFPKGDFRLENLYRDTSTRADTEFTTSIDRIENKSEALLEIEMNKLSYGFGYSHFLKDYDKDTYRTLEYEEDIFTLIGYYKLFPKTKLLLEYNHGEIDYDLDSTRKGNYVQIRTGLKGELTGKTTGTVKVGYQDRDYDTKGEKDLQSSVAELELSTQFNSDTKLELNYQSTALESTYSTNNFYESDRISAQFNQKIGNRLSAITSLAFENNDYPEETTVGSEAKKRVDDIWTIGLGVEYSLKDYLKTKLAYEYKNRDSNINSQDYKRNLILLTFTFSL